VEPKIVMLDNGLQVVSSGRPGIYIWVRDTAAAAAAGSAGSEWTAFNIAAHHNQVVADPALRYTSTTPSSRETTAYTGMVAVPGGENAVIVSYDRLANGWNPAPFPSGVSAIFTVRINITRP
jgi:hypothetical protein